MEDHVTLESRPSDLVIIQCQRFRLLLYWLLRLGSLAHCMQAAQGRLVFLLFVLLVGRLQAHSIH